MKKRVTSILMAIAMLSTLFTIMPMTAYALSDTYQTISAGTNMSAAIKKDGTLWMWGRLPGGEQPSPVKVMDGVSSVSICGSTIFAITTDGILWGWGSNENGQLGNSVSGNQSEPVKLLDKVVSVKGSAYYTLAIRQDAALWAWGGDFGEAPRKLMTDAMDVSIYRDSLYIVKMDRTLLKMDSSVFGVPFISSDMTERIMDSAVSVCSASNSLHVLKEDGSLWADGNSMSGMIGDGLNESRQGFVRVMDDVKSMNMSANHALVLKKDGSLWAWGNNAYGQTAMPPGSSPDKPIQILENVSAVSAGMHHSLAIKADGTLWAWGRNTNGQLGSGQLSESERSPTKIMDGVALQEGLPRPDPSISLGMPWGPDPLEKGALPLPKNGPLGTVAVGHNYFAALRPDHTLWTWGSKWAPGWNGQQSNDAIDGRLKIMDDVVFISTCNVNKDYLLAIQSDGSLWVCMGKNQWDEYGPVGDGTTEYKPEPFKIMDDVVFADAGADNAIAIQSDGSLWAWGNENIYFGDSGPQLSPVRIMEGVTQAAVGNQNIMALLVDNSLWACGDSTYLGAGTRDRSAEFIKIMDDVIQVGAGWEFTMALKSDGTLWAWGSNDRNRLGDGSTEDRLLPVKIMDGVASFSAGSSLSLAVKNDGSLWVWGDATGNITPQLFDKVDDVAAAQCSNLKIIAIKNDGTIVIFRDYKEGAGQTINFDSTSATPNPNNTSRPGNNTTPPSNNPASRNSGIPLPFLLGGGVLIIGIVVAVVVIVSSEKKKKRR